MSGLRRYSSAGLYLTPLIVGIMAIVATCLLFQFWLFLRLPGSSARGSRLVDIQPGMGALSIARLLHGELVISEPRQFYVLCSLRGVGHKLQAGEYAFLPLSTPDQIIDQMVSGRVVLHRITIPEGSDIFDVARILGESGLASHEKVLDLARDRSYIGGFELPLDSLEGYLFPDTYNVRKSQDERSLLKGMVQQFRLHFPQSWRTRSEQLGLSVHEVVTIASLVEKEAVVDAERPLIAAVFLNRLKRDMPLQSDPSTVYDLPGFSGPITGNELKRESPYNTYLHRGLPAGPICSPGAKSLEAVLFHDKVPYLYFVSNNDGTHHFSESYDEHRRAVTRYRQLRKGSAAALPTDQPSGGKGEDDAPPTPQPTRVEQNGTE